MTHTPPDENQAKSEGLGIEGDFERTGTDFGRLAFILAAAQIEAEGAAPVLQRFGDPHLGYTDVAALTLAHSPGAVRSPGPDPLTLCITESRKRLMPIGLSVSAYRAMMHTRRPLVVKT